MTEGSQFLHTMNFFSEETTAEWDYRPVYTKYIFQYCTDPVSGYLSSVTDFLSKVRCSQLQWLGYAPLRLQVIFIQIQCL
jgi:hypothetical protein